MQWQPKKRPGRKVPSVSLRDLSVDRLRQLGGRIKLPTRRKAVLPEPEVVGVAEPIAQPIAQPRVETVEVTDSAVSVSPAEVVAPSAEITPDMEEIDLDALPVSEAVSPAEPSPDGPLTRSEEPEHTPIPLPAVVARAAPFVRQLALGVLLSIIGVVAMLFSSAFMLRLNTTSRVLPAAGNLAAMMVALASIAQWRLWYLALQEWRGKRDVALERWLVISRVSAWIAGAAMLLGMIAVGIQLRHGWADLSYALSILGVVCMTLGGSLAAIHSFRPGGPPGVPSLITRNRRLR